MKNPFEKPTADGSNNTPPSENGFISFTDTNTPHIPKNRESSLTDCHFFLKAHCNKGSLCQYRHSQPLKSNGGLYAEECSEWKMFQCSDLECAKQHPPRKANPKETICWFYVNKTCTNVNCPFIHPIVDKKGKDKNKSKKFSLTDLDSDSSTGGARKKNTSTAPRGKGSSLSFSLDDLENDTPPSRQQKSPARQMKASPVQQPSRKRSSDLFSMKQPEDSPQSSTPAASTAPRSTKNHGDKLNTTAEKLVKKETASPMVQKTIKQETASPMVKNSVKKETASPSVAPIKQETASPMVKKETASPNNAPIKNQGDKLTTSTKRKREAADEASPQPLKKSKLSATKKSPSSATTKKSVKQEEEDEELAFLEGLI